MNNLEAFADIVMRGEAETGVADHVPLSEGSEGEDSDCESSSSAPKTPSLNGRKSTRGMYGPFSVLLILVTF